MATNRMEIDIYVRDEARVDEESQIGKGNSINGLSTKTSQKSKSNTALKTFVVSQTVSVFLDNSKGFISNNIGLVTGRKQLQQQVDFAIDTVQRVTHLSENAAAGAAITTAMGMGGGIGVAIGLAVTAVSYAINKAFEQAQLNIQRNLQDKQIQGTRSHLGAWVNKSRSGL